MIRAGDKIGPYTLIRKLGRGTFGVVWLAEKHTALAVTKVALKLPNDDDINLEAVKREAAVWVEASGHPNGLPIIDADIYDEQVVIVSEYAPDGSLTDWPTLHVNMVNAKMNSLVLESNKEIGTVSENLETLFDAARKLPLEEQKLLAEKLLEATKESESADDDKILGKAGRHFGAWDSGNAQIADTGAEWNALAELLDDSAVEIDIPDLAHEHDHYLYGKTKKN
jgi:Protein tyrosine and serine/threonine kinase